MRPSIFTPEVLVREFDELGVLLLRWRSSNEISIEKYNYDTCVVYCSKAFVDRSRQCDPRVSHSKAGSERNVCVRLRYFLNPRDTQIYVFQTSSYHVELFFVNAILSF